MSGKCRCENPTVGTAVRLTDNTLVDTAAVAAWDGTHVGVAYLRQIKSSGLYYNLRFALLNPDGTLVKDVALTNYVDGTYESAGNGYSENSNATTDRPAIVWNGSEYAVVWQDYDGDAAIRSSMKLVRISAAGTPGTTVTVMTESETSTSAPSVGWSVPYGGYLVGGNASSEQRAFLRRVGAQGTTLEPWNGYATYSCRSSSLAVAPSGTTALSCQSTSGTVGYFNPDGSRTRPPSELGFAFLTAEPETVWYGATFGTSSMSDSGRIIFTPDGRTAATPWIELLPYDSAAGRSAFSSAWLGSSLALATVQKKTYLLRRFGLTNDPNGTATSLHDPVSIVSTANVINKPLIASAGSGKLIAIWQDDRWGTVGELYAAPIDLKGCP